MNRFRLQPRAALRARALAASAVLVVVAALVLVAGAAATASASSAVRPAPGMLDPRLMVLTSADLSGAKVTAQGYYKDKEFSSVISYSRELEDGRFGSTLLPYVDSEAEVGTSAATTRNFLLSYRALLGTKQGRRMIVESIAEEAGEDGLLSNIQVGRPRNLGVGPGSFVVLISARILGARTEFPMAAFRVERVLGVVSAMGIPGRRLPLTTMTRLAKIMAARMTVELTPRSTTPPTISGEPIVGQTVTASTGTWSGKPTSFTYQWQQCDGAGAACTPIADATSAAYVVSQADVGRTLRVTVTARNSVGASSPAASAPTGVVRALTDSVTGAGQRMFRTNTPPVRVEIDARSGSTGNNPSGSFLMRFPVGAWWQSGLELRGDVVCLTVRGNRASVGAVIRQSNNDLLPVGTGAWLAVTDNGQPGAGKDTQLSYLGSEVNPQVCTIPVQANEFPEIVLTDGDFVVRDE